FARQGGLEPVIYIRLSAPGYCPLPPAAAGRRSPRGCVPSFGANSEFRSVRIRQRNTQNTGKSGRNLQHVDNIEIFSLSDPGTRNEESRPQFRMLGKIAVCSRGGDLPKQRAVETEFHLIAGFHIDQELRGWKSAHLLQFLLIHNAVDAVGGIGSQPL